MEDGNINTTRMKTYTSSNSEGMTRARASMRVRRPPPERPWPATSATAAPQQEWVPVRSQKKPKPAELRHDGGGDRGCRGSSWRPSSRSTTSTWESFSKATEGRCFNFLARDHRASSCRDPMRCFRCRCSGHKERFCKSRPTKIAAPPSALPTKAKRWVTPALPAPQPPPTAAPVEMARGDLRRKQSLSPTRLP